jgi:hypothetical protein
VKLKKHVLFVLLFILVQGLTFAFTFYVMGYRYASAGEARFSAISEAILALMVLYYIRRYASWPAAGYGNFSWRRALWMAPLLLPVLIYAGYLSLAIASARPDGLAILGVAAVALMTLLVGFVEETTFRGILLRGEMAAGRNVFVAMIISAIGFSLLHSVNVFAGMPPAEMLGQLRVTLIVGLCLAPLALLTGNLIPLVIWHFLWDFGGLVTTQVSLTQTNVLFESINLAVIPLQYAMGVIGWVAVFALWRRGKFRVPAAAQAAPANG